MELSGTELNMLACLPALVHSAMVSDPEYPSSVLHGLLLRQAFPPGCPHVSGTLFFPPLPCPQFPDLKVLFLSSISECLKTAHF